MKKKPERPLDSDGQPISKFIGAAHREDRDVAEILGVAKGLLADGIVLPIEAEYLADWINSHPDAASTWPCSVLADRLNRIFDDGVVTEAERLDLKELLDSLVGGQAGMIGGEAAATTLPLDSPPPPVLFPGRSFAFTGKFAMGPRDECERMTVNAGGACGSGPTKQTNYLVIGTFASRDWIQTSHGRKIEKAVQYRDAGVPIAIIAEDHWAGALPK